MYRHFKTYLHRLCLRLRVTTSRGLSAKSDDNTRSVLRHTAIVNPSSGRVYHMWWFTFYPDTICIIRESNALFDSQLFCHLIPLDVACPPAMSAVPYDCACSRKKSSLARERERLISSSPFLFFTLFFHSHTMR